MLKSIFLLGQILGIKLKAILKLWKHSYFDSMCKRKLKNKQLRQLPE